MGGLLSFYQHDSYELNGATPKMEQDRYVSQATLSNWAAWTASSVASSRRRAGADGELAGKGAFKPARMGVSTNGGIPIAGWSISWKIPSRNG